MLSSFFHFYHSEENLAYRVQLIHQPWNTVDELIGCPVGTSGLKQWTASLFPDDLTVEHWPKV